MHSPISAIADLVACSFRELFHSPKLNRFYQPVASLLQATSYRQRLSHSAKLLTFANCFPPLNNSFITCQLFNLAFECFKSCKLTDLFTSVTANKLISSILFELHGDSGHYTVSLNALGMLLHILVNKYLKRMVWKLVNFHNGNIPDFAQLCFFTTFICLEKVIVSGQLNWGAPLLAMLCHLSIKLDYYKTPMRNGLSDYATSETAA